jgi:hypothetical protein
MALKIHIMVSWVMASYSLVGEYQWFEETILPSSSGNAPTTLHMKLEAVHSAEMVCITEWHNVDDINVNISS